MFQSVIGIVLNSVTKKAIRKIATWLGDSLLYRCVQEWIIPPPEIIGNIPLEWPFICVRWPVSLLQGSSSIDCCRLIVIVKSRNPTSGQRAVNERSTIVQINPPLRALARNMSQSPELSWRYFCLLYYVISINIIIYKFKIIQRYIYKHVCPRSFWYCL